MLSLQPERSIRAAGQMEVIMQIIGRGPAATVPVKPEGAP
jgi:hypothetical protein